MTETKPEQSKQTPIKIDWTTVGKEYIRTDSDKNKVLKEATFLEWIPIGGNHPFSQAFAIKEAIKQFKLPKVDLISYGGGFGLSCEPSAGFGLLGIQANYKGNRVRVYLLDGGNSVTPIFMEVFEK